MSEAPLSKAELARRRREKVLAAQKKRMAIVQETTEEDVEMPAEYYQAQARTSNEADEATSAVSETPKRPRPTIFGIIEIVLFTFCCTGLLALHSDVLSQYVPAAARLSAAVSYYSLDLLKLYLVCAGLMFVFRMIVGREGAAGTALKQVKGLPTRIALCFLVAVVTGQILVLVEKRLA